MRSKAAARMASSPHVRTDTVTLASVLTFVIVASALADLDVRGWSLTMGAVAFTGVVWRVVSTWPDMTDLGRALGVVLGLDLLVGAIAQAIVASQANPPPPSGLGVGLIIASRVVVLTVVLFWGVWLHRWHRVRR